MLQINFPGGHFVSPEHTMGKSTEYPSKLDGSKTLTLNPTNHNQSAICKRLGSG